MKNEQMKNVTLKELTDLLTDHKFCDEKTIKGYLEFLIQGSPKKHPKFKKSKKVNEEIIKFMKDKKIYNEIINCL